MCTHTCSTATALATRSRKNDSARALVTLFCAVFFNSPAARLAFHSEFPDTAVSYSRTRWFGWYDIVVHTLLDNWVEVLNWFEIEEHTWCAEQRTSFNAFVR